jgi:hypothetical protein
MLAKTKTRWPSFVIAGFERVRHVLLALRGETGLVLGNACDFIGLGAKDAANLSRHRE